MKFALPGLLVEYLINGVCALLWLMPLFPQGIGFDPLYLAPAVYVLGMQVDFVAMFLLTPFKTYIRSKAREKRGLGEQHRRHDNSRRKIKIELYAPDLAHEAEMRSSRDRIARGTIINAAMIAILPNSLPLQGALLMLSVSFPMWILFEYMSYTYLLDAEAALDARAAQANASGPAHDKAPV